MGNKTKTDKKYDVFARIMKDYPDYQYRFGDIETECLYMETPVVICFRLKDYLKCSEVDLFDLLHEIGHAKTDKEGNSRCVREYEATKWAIKHAKKYGVILPDWRRKEFQDDILFWKKMEKGLQIKMDFPKTKFYSDKKLLLDWSPMDVTD